jgi:hypothetical protein
MQGSILFLRTPIPTSTHVSSAVRLAGPLTGAEIAVGSTFMAVEEPTRPALLRAPGPSGALWSPHLQQSAARSSAAPVPALAPAMAADVPTRSRPVASGDTAVITTLSQLALLDYTTASGPPPAAVGHSWLREGSEARAMPLRTTTHLRTVWRP